MEDIKLSQTDFAQAKPSLFPILNLCFHHEDSELVVLLVEHLRDLNVCVHSDS